MTTNTILRAAILLILPVLASGCVAATDSESLDTDETEATEESSQAIEGCAVRSGYNAGQPATFPTMDDPVIAYKLQSLLLQSDEMGQYLPFSIQFCHESSWSYTKYYHHYFFGAFAGLWIEPPLLEPQ
ncbi:hypothetical protein [Polyangium sorediatum]|uniref:Lipoprotein n=1 Tax=Polyangium sorediatum TaxID=889274 RepID=A0ABT6NSA8_9BACT|nr:hypothetical protein [Polyangium sorediatum]MDI1431057.1 hypothetical protein [Polyangium sorediatum]